MDLKKIMFQLLHAIKKIEPEYIVLLPIIFMAYYYQLGVAPVYMWDEGVYASNALEMIKSGNIFIKFFDNMPEMWATQPPLVAWFQAFSMWIFGISETALRLPSALAATILSIFLLNFFRKEFDSISWGFFAALVLSLSSGFVIQHIARSGDLDIFVTLFNTLYVLYFYRLYKSDFKNTNYLFKFILFVFLAFWAKTIAGLIFLPVILFFVLFSKNRLLFFSNIKLYIYITFFASLTIFYYWYREIKTPGYIETAFMNEFWGRFTGQIQDVHIQPFFFYWEYIRNSGFVPWIFFIPLSFFLSFYKEHKTRFLFIYLSVLILFFWLIISLSTVKLYWYSGPLFPLLSILAAFSIKYIYETIVDKINIKHFLLKLSFLIIFTTSIFINNLFIIERNNLNNARRFSSDLIYGLALNDISQNYPHIKEIFILQPGFAPNVIYYKNYYNLFKDYKIQIIEIRENITIIPDSYILYYNSAVTNLLDKEYNYEIVYQNKDVSFVHVLNRKTPINKHYGIDPDRDIDLLMRRNRDISTKAYTGKHSLKLSSNNQFSIIWKFSVKDLRIENINSIRVSSYAYSSNINNSGLLVFAGDSGMWKGIELKGILKEENSWNNFDTTFVLESFLNSNNNIISIYFWNKSQDSLLLDDIGIELLK